MVVNIQRMMLVAAVCLSLAGQAMAVTSIQDPGAVGSIITNYTSDVVMLPGPNSESVEVMFDNMKNLRFGQGAFTTLQARVIGIGNAPGGGNFQGDITWGLLDENGNRILSESTGSGALASASIGLIQPADPALVAHGFFLDFDPDVGPTIGPNARVEFGYQGDALVGDLDSTNGGGVTSIQDPGPVGSMINGYTSDAVRLLGPDTESVTMLFDDMKHLEFEPGSFLEASLIGLGLVPGGGNFQGNLTWGLVDENGTRILSRSTGPDRLASSRLGLIQPVDTPLVAHGYFLEVDPDVGPIGLNTRVDFGYRGNVTVGEWAVAQGGAVPEPVTAVLGVMGLATLGLATRRRAA